VSDRRQPSHLRRHLLSPDPDIPPDYHNRRRCLVCKRMSRPGDSHHIDPTAAVRPARPLSPDFEAAAAARDAAILGEKEDDE